MSIACQSFVRTDPPSKSISGNQWKLWCSWQIDWGNDSRGQDVLNALLVQNLTSDLLLHHLLDLRGSNIILDNKIIDLHVIFLLVVLLDTSMIDNDFTPSDHIQHIREDIPSRGTGKIKFIQSQGFQFTFFSLL